MKLLIEIPDIVKNHCDDGGILQTIDIIKLKNAVAHGEPLDSVLDGIRAKIQENVNYNKRMDYLGIVAGLLLALDIIDKYKAESEEGEEE